MWVRENRKLLKSQWGLAAKPSMGKNNLGKEVCDLENGRKVEN